MGNLNLTTRAIEFKKKVCIYSPAGGTNKDTYSLRFTI